MKTPIAKISLSLVLVFFAACGQARNLKVERLRCEYLVNPLGVDSPQPRLSWTLDAKERGQVQTAYQLLLADSLEALRKNQGDIWDTGKVTSDQTIRLSIAVRSLDYTPIPELALLHCSHLACWACGFLDGYRPESDCASRVLIARHDVSLDAARITR